ncbi:unnamed protein product (macronuclear) [Paramecium tetraurelia]|uniref:PSI domain-containing protein n=1 Tax=Paramecium tetraurelia TaxID=5888 RepID=A0DSV6_PARTE|nr:uncharacterized protein GSPATT00019816001 [Paramecium tetraurelia]CAK86123.1 unnamed protein product [Paramecium tetraurelia]|eukprot:XP_001453520.1 hypothetical protein (macronuclear) [Paramecium tetraurelia strain d4-2]
MKTVLGLLTIILGLCYCSTIETTTPCTCQQLTQNDCIKNSGCAWNKTCDVKTITQTKSINYCSYLNEQQCQSDDVCQWVNSQCTFFTGCTAYKLTSDRECKSINKRCYKSDLKKCIELSECVDYTDPIICFMDVNQRYCYWDTKINRCSKALDCQSQPSALDTDAKCRSQISTCTAKPGGGCMDAYQGCSDITLEIQCFYNKDQSSQCFWDNSVNPPLCKVKICENAPATLKTDELCKSFLPQCTTKINGGCAQRSTCDAATTRNACIKDQQGNDCFWVDGFCKQKLCNNATKEIVTNVGCQSISQDCITKSGGGCMTNGECSTANIDYACKVNIRGEQCFWDSVAQQCKDKTCTNAPQNLSTYEQCSKFLETCTVNSLKQGCEDRTCENAPVFVTTLDGCQDYYNESCIPKQNGGCVTINTCEEILLELSCVKDKLKRPCFWNEGKCLLKICTNIPKTSQKPVTLDHSKCNEFMQTCTYSQSSNNCINYTCDNVQDNTICLQNQQCYYRETCYTKTCFTAPLSYATHQQCFLYKNTCTLAPSGQGCSIMLQTCSLYKNKTQCVQSVATACQWSDDACVERQCNLADISYNTTLKCQQYLTGCVVNNQQQGCIPEIKKCEDSSIQQNCTLDVCEWKTNKCVTKQCSNQKTNCLSYKTPIQCINNDGSTSCMDVPNTCTLLPKEYCKPAQSYDLIKKYCFIQNVVNCVELTLETECSSYSDSMYCIKRNNNKGNCVWVDGDCYNDDCTQLPNTLTSSSECQTAIPRCILNNSGEGCTNKNECSAYNDKNCDQLDKNGYECVYKNSQCQKKSCATSDATNHTDCYKYLSTGTKCTVNSNGNGCIELTSCSNYSKESQCVISNLSKVCYWSNGKCFEKKCSLETTSTTHDQCQVFMSGCTLDTNTNLGCTEFPECQQIQDPSVCNSNPKCVYLSNNCIIKTCENAILTEYNNTSCSSLPFEGCAFDSNFCSTKTCAQYEFSTDEQCSQQNSNCTTNGKTCTERLDCNKAVAEQGCKKDIFGNYCQWNEISKTCTLRNCTTAPTSLTTETQCQQYYDGCTTKLGGGCTTKSTCSAANVQAACNTSKHGEVCSWDDTIQQCRNQSCVDFNGSDYKTCNKQNSKCTTNGLGKCFEIAYCSQYLNAQSCIMGGDGPCLWVNGQCYLYRDCTSIKFKTHQECQKVSDKCTTDGNKCVSITECSQTNTNGGCLLGIEGKCIMTVNDKDVKVCTTFKKCSDAKLKTHTDCNTANNGCTTDGTQCTELLACKDYKIQEQCYLDIKGAVSVNNKISSTGICKWDGSCRAQTCEDLTGTTHSICNTQMMTCTSNGTNCYTMDKCQNYSTKELCNTALGSDGKCIYSTSNTKCQLMACSDITNNICNILDNCVTDGTKCIAKTNCASYTSQVSCEISGTDGTCLWNATTKKCALFSACSIAADQNQCNKMNKVCSWDTTSNKCVDLTCQIQFKSTNNCVNISTWIPSQIRTCSLVNGVCQEIDVQAYGPSECYLLTQYTYTYNTSLQKCTQCSTTTTNQTNNTVNDTDDTVDNYQYLIALGFSVLSLFLF